VTLIVDAGPLIALDDVEDPARAFARPYFVQSSEELVVPAPITAEADYLIGRRLGRVARLAFLAGHLPSCPPTSDLQRADAAGFCEAGGRMSRITPG